MELPVMMYEETVGSCSLEQMGLYWIIRCRCRILSDRVERLYAGEKKLGVLEKEGECLTLTRRISRSSCPELPPKSGVLTLHPVEEAPALTPWEGTIQGYELRGFEKDDMLLFPYDPEEPCPCEPLFCFFEVSDGYWKLPKETDCLK